DAVRLLKKVVAERGDEFVYKEDSGCFYAHNGGPSCGVGLALHMAGVPVNVLSEMDRIDQSEISNTETLDVLALLHDMTLTPTAVQVFQRFQSNQDSGLEYGAALDFALTGASK